MCTGGAASAAKATQKEGGEAALVTAPAQATRGQA
jgi:hypothetical protein